LNNPIKYVDPSGHDVDCGLGESNCKKPKQIPIPGCKAEYCKRISLEERRRMEEAYRAFLKDPVQFAELWANPDLWYNDKEAFYFRGYAEYYLNSFSDQILLEGVAEAYGDEFAKKLNDLHQYNIYAAAGLSNEDMKMSGFFPPSFIPGGHLFGFVQVVGGQYEFFAETAANGNTLTLRGLMFFPVGDTPPPGSAKVIALRTQLMEEARALGYDTLELEYTRISGANPGKTMVLRIPLSGGDRK
jgi:hypothetical protein